MTDNHIIKPVKGLQNIGALSPIQQRDKRKQNHNPKKQHKEDNNHDEAVLSEFTNEQILDNEITENSEEHNVDKTEIDFCA